MSNKQLENDENQKSLWAELDNLLEDTLYVDYERSDFVRERCGERFDAVGRVKSMLLELRAPVVGT